MNRGLGLLAGVVVLVVVALAAVWWSSRGTVSGAALTAQASPGIADPHQAPPIVPIYPADGAVEVDARLCPASEKSLPKAIPSALWAGAGKTWHIAARRLTWEGNAECKAFAFKGVASEIWPGVDHGVVLWAVVVGDGAEGAPDPVHPANSWRQRGLLVVDGQAVRKGDQAINLH